MPSGGGGEEKEEEEEEEAKVHLIGLNDINTAAISTEAVLINNAPALPIGVNWQKHRWMGRGGGPKWRSWIDSRADSIGRGGRDRCGVDTWRPPAARHRFTAMN